MIQLNSCFWCIDIKLGCLLSSAIHFLGEAGCIIAVGLTYSSLSGQQSIELNVRKSPLTIEGYEWAVFGLPLIFCIIRISITIAMIFGVLKHKPNCMVPFLVINAIELVFGFFLSLAYMAICFMVEGATTKACCLLLLLPLLALSVYIWLIIYNRFEEIVIENEFEGMRSKPDVPSDSNSLNITKGRKTSQIIPQQSATFATRFSADYSGSGPSRRIATIHPPPYHVV